MFEDYENKKRKQIILMRSIMDYGMGILFLLIGLFFLFSEKFDFHFRKSDPWLEKMFGGLCILYAAWRIYRGYKKNYFR
jgi:ABC-type nickel/cobalt efflux system permease component RcnA